jgi:hypothetical protein
MEGGMRRFATFVLLGPLLVWLMFFILQVPQLIRVPSADPLPVFAIAIPVAVIVCFVPALILAGADHLMAQKGFSRMIRAAICAVLGYPLAVLGFYVAIEAAHVRSLFIDGLFTAGLFGIVPAAVCAWVSEKKTKAFAPANG